MTERPASALSRGSRADTEMGRRPRSAGYSSNGGSSGGLETDANELLEMMERERANQLLQELQESYEDRAQSDDSHPEGNVPNGSVVSQFRSKAERNLIMNARALKRDFEEKSYALQLAMENMRQRRDAESEYAAMLAEREYVRAEHAWKQCEETLAGLEHANGTVAHARRRQETIALQRFASRRKGYEEGLLEWQDAEAAKIQRSMSAAKLGVTAARQRVAEHMEIISEGRAQLRKQLHEERERRLLNVLDLKKATEEVKDKLKERSEREVQKRRRKQAAVDEEMQNILLSGGNPYEVFREREQRVRLDKVIKDRSEVQKQREMEIVQRIQKERIREMKQLEVDQLNREFARRFVEDMGPDRQAEKIAAYVSSRTIDGRDIVDPTGRLARVDGSKVSNSKPWSFGTGNKLAREDILRLMQNKFPKAVEAVVTGPSASIADKNRNDAATSLVSPTFPASRSAGGVGAKPMSTVDKDDDIAVLSLQTMGQSEFAVSWKPPVDQNSQSLVEDDDDEGAVETEGGPSGGQRQMSKLERQYMHDARLRHKSNLTTKQVVWGKEFDGQAFLPSPSQVCFRDFDVGSEYSLSFTLTNISLTFNTFKLLPLDDAFVDYFDISFVLPGAMSAGMSCTIKVTFRPKVNKDINTVIPFLAQTGAFNVPLVCATKKCLISSSPTASDVVDFGQVVLAETATRTITITNAGALESEFAVEFSADSDALSVTPCDGGFADPFSATKVMITFRPMSLGEVHGTLTLRFLREGVSSMTFPVFAVGKEVPIYVDRPLVDFRTCMAGILYRDVIRICNRGKVAMKVSLKRRSTVTPACDMEFVPQMGFVQPGIDNALQVQIKIRCHHPCSTDAMDICSSVPEDISISDVIDLIIPDQAMPVDFAVNTIVTPGVILCSPSILDFGVVPTNSTVSRSFQIRNVCSLPRTIALTSPLDRDCFDFVPSGGMGMLLPWETRVFSVQWSPKYVSDYRDGDNSSLSFNVESVDAVDSCSRIVCIGRSVDSPLCADKLFLRLRACARGDTITETVVLRNNSKTSSICCHVSSIGNPFLSAAPNIFDLNSGESIPLVVTFAPPFDLTAEDVDRLTGEFLIACHVQGSDYPATSLTVATSVVQPTLLVTPTSSVDFGSTAMLSTVRRTIYLEYNGVDNLGDLPVECDLLDPYGAFAVVSALPRSMCVGEKYPFTVTFTPKLAATYRLTVKVRHSAANSVEITLVGTGVVPHIEISPASLLCVGDLVLIPGSLTVPSNVTPVDPKAKASEVPVVREREALVSFLTESSFMVPVHVSVESITGDTDVFRVIPEDFELHKGSKVDVKIKFAPIKQSSVRYGCHACRLVVHYGGQREPRWLYVYGFVHVDGAQLMAPVLSTDDLLTLQRVKPSKFVPLNSLTNPSPFEVLIPSGQTEAKLRVYGAGDVTFESTHKAFRVEPSKLVLAATGEAKDVSVVFSPNKEEERKSLPPVTCQDLRVSVEGSVKVAFKSGKIQHVQVRADLIL